MSVLRKLPSRKRNPLEFAIIQTIFKYQYEEEPKGILWGELLNSVSIKTTMMSRQTFSNRLKDLFDKGLVEKEKIIGQRGNPTLYRLEPNLYAGLMEFGEMSFPGYLKNEIERFEKDIESFETKIYIEDLMELALARLNVLAIAIMVFKTEGARWMFYEENYQNIEQILGYILNRASRSKEDKKQTLNKLFEILEPFSNRPIGRRFELHEIYNAKDDIIRNIVEM